MKIPCGVVQLRANPIWLVTLLLISGLSVQTVAQHIEVALDTELVENELTVRVKWRSQDISQNRLISATIDVDYDPLALRYASTVSADTLTGDWISWLAQGVNVIFSQIPNPPAPVGTDPYVRWTAFGAAGCGASTKTIDDWETIAVHRFDVLGTHPTDLLVRRGSLSIGVCDEIDQAVEACTGTENTDDPPLYGVCAVNDATGIEVPNEASIVFPNEAEPAFRLYPPFPNPVIRTTTIRYELAETALVRLEIFDLLGRRVFQSNQREFPAGHHSRQLNLSELRAGSYYLRITAGSKVLSAQVKVLP